jgi:hypothetical protein
MEAADLTQASGGADPGRAGSLLGPPMSRMIVYTCPKTGRDVPSGILTDDDSFAHLPHEKVTVQCTECGDRHEYWTSEARLAEDAKDKKPDTG